MISRLLQVGTSFAIVLVAYGAYSLLAVPLIEPPAAPPADPAKLADVSPLPASQQALDELKVLFPPGSWELKDPILLESDRVKLLAQNYQSLGNGWVDLTPLTMVLLSEDSGGESASAVRERIRHATVLQVPEGARLRFAQGIDLARSRIGRPTKGKLRGAVTVRRRGKLPGPEDDLLVRTRDVQLSEQRIWTSQNVDFRWGPNQGRGRDLEIKLLPRDGPPKGNSVNPNDANPNIGGIEQIEVRHVERFHMELGQVGAGTQPVSPGGPAAAHRPGPAAAPPGGRRPGARHALGGGQRTCPGRGYLPRAVPLQSGRAAGDVQGSGRRAAAAARRARRPAELRAAVDLLCAVGQRGCTGCGRAGDAATARRRPGAPTAAAGGPRHARHLLLPHRQDPGPWRTAHVQPPVGRSLLARRPRGATVPGGPGNPCPQPAAYTPGAAGHVGRLLATGPGWLRGPMADRPGELVEARWTDRLELRPQGAQQVISLTGGARLITSAMGRLDAREIHFWLFELPAAAGSQSQLQPDRLSAHGAVRVESPQVSGAVDQLEIWFESPPAPPAGPALPLAVSPPAGPALPLAVSPPGIATAAPPSADQRASVPLRSMGPPPVPPASAAPPARPQHFEILGRLLQARVLLHDRQQGELVELSVEDNARFTETQTAQPGEQPLVVTGRRVHVKDANRPQAAADVVGRRPASRAAAST